MTISNSDHLLDDLHRQLNQVMWQVNEVSEVLANVEDMIKDGRTELAALYVKHALEVLGR